MPFSVSNTLEAEYFWINETMQNISLLYTFFLCRTKNRSLYAENHINIAHCFLKFHKEVIIGIINHMITWLVWKHKLVLYDEIGGPLKNNNEFQIFFNGSFSKPVS